MSISVLYSATVANDAGGGAGESVSVSVNVPFTRGTTPPAFVTPASGPLVAGYAAVLVNPSQPCMWNVTDQSPQGFTVTLTPSSGVTLEAGTFSVTVLG